MFMNIYVRFIYVYTHLCMTNFLTGKTIFIKLIVSNYLNLKSILQYFSICLFVLHFSKQSIIKIN